MNLRSGNFPPVGGTEIKSQTPSKTLIHCEATRQRESNMERTVSVAAVLLTATILIGGAATVSVEGKATAQASSYM